MIPLFALLQIAMPLETNSKLNDVRALFSPDDMPRRLEVSGKSARLITRTTVKDDGSIVGCIAEVSSGDPTIDEHTCKIILRRARFLPARWSDGTPVYGVVRVPIAWIMGFPPPPSNDNVYDIEIMVERLPTGAGSSARVTVAASVDETGNIIDCIGFPAPRPRRRDAYFAELNGLACQQIKKDMRLVPPKDEEGNPVRSIQAVSALFVGDRR